LEVALERQKAMAREGVLSSRFPVAICFMRADLQVGFSWGISIQLRGEPLEPFKSLL